MTGQSEKQHRTGSRIVMGKIALVTGGGTGIGKAAALAFAAEGARVAVAGQAPEPLHETVREIEANGGEAIAIPTDVAKDDEIKKLVGDTVARFGRLDVAFNNAGVEIFKRMGPQGIRINNVSPGVIDTPMSRRNGDAAVLKAFCRSRGIEAARTAVRCRRRGRVADDR